MTFTGQQWQGRVCCVTADKLKTWMARPRIFPWRKNTTLDRWRAHENVVDLRRRQTVESGCHESPGWAEVDIGCRSLWMGGYALLEAYLLSLPYWKCGVLNMGISTYDHRCYCVFSYLQLCSQLVQFETTIFEKNVPKSLLPITSPKLASNNRESSWGQ